MKFWLFSKYTFIANFGEEVGSSLFLYYNYFFLCNRFPVPRKHFNMPLSGWKLLLLRRKSFNFICHTFLEIYYYKFMDVSFHTIYFSIIIIPISPYLDEYLADHPYSNSIFAQIIADFFHCIFNTTGNFNCIKRFK